MVGNGNVLKLLNYKIIFLYFLGFNLIFWRVIEGVVDIVLMELGVVDNFLFDLNIVGF